MIKRVIATTLLVMFMGPAPGSWAESQKTGFSSRIDIGIGWMYTQSLIEPGDDNKRLSSLNDKAASETKLVVLPSFQLDYRWDNGTMVYLGIPLGGEPRPTLGTRYELPHGSEIDLSLFYGLPQTVWEDPYLVGVDRKETDETQYGAAIAYGIGDFEFSYEIQKTEIDNDLVARRLPDLTREGIVHTLGAGYEFEFDNGIELVSSLKYTMADMDGSSSSYKGYSAGLELRKFWDNIGVNLSLEVGRNEYDAAHPVFNTTREDDTVEAMAVVSWLAPLGYQNLSVNIGGGYEESNSSIGFYDAEATLGFFTIGYRFGGR